ncbi:MAG: hypothetical protein OEW02_10745, partial [Myxococcales bacterium]|nr:hypothetical protein [Myxococcales bacterium]
QTIRLLRTLGRHMKKSDILKLLASPFRRRALTRKPALPARMIDPGRMEPIRETASGGARPSVA